MVRSRNNNHPRTTATMKWPFALLALSFLWLLGFPPYVDGFFAVAVCLFCLRSNLVEIIVVSLSLEISVLVSFLLLSLFQSSLTTFYREHEKWLAPNGIYRPNVTDTIQMPHGDLLALDPLAPLTLVEPRTVHFKTDSWGYRNDHDYQGEKYVLLGDSFLVANGTT